MGLASRGARETDDGIAPIDDAAVVEALKRKARMVYVKTAVVTVWMLGVVALPRLLR